MKKYLFPFIVALIGGLVIVYAFTAESRASETYKKERWNIIMSNIEKTEVAKINWQSAIGKKEDLEKQCPVQIQEQINAYQQEEVRAEEARKAIQQACAELGIELKACLGDYYENIFTIDPVVKVDVFFTSYNPVSAQTDASPCIGASGVDQCYMVKEKRIIALSQDLVSHNGKTLFHYGDRVKLISDGDSRCNGEFVVLDTLNKRYTKRGDLFFMDRKDNTSCNATVIKI